MLRSAGSSHQPAAEKIRVPVHNICGGGCVASGYFLSFLVDSFSVFGQTFCWSIRREQIANIVSESGTSACAYGSAQTPLYIYCTGSVRTPNTVWRPSRLYRYVNM